MPTYLQDLQKGLSDLFANDPRVILLGEDVLDPYGGAFKVTAGLSTSYPDRVLTTPISEAAITGVAAGLALRGHVPIVEIMFGDFLTLCADQIVNHASKFPHMYKETGCPLILRTPMGGGRGYGPTHSQSLEKMFLGIPGLRLVAPSVYHRPGDTLKGISGKESGPVIFIEHKLLYPALLETGHARLEADETGYQTAIVRNYTMGTPDVCLIAYGGVSRFLPALLAELGAEEIRVLAVLPESIDPFPADTLAAYAAEAGRVVIAEESHDGFTWASGVAAELYARLWGRIACPIRIVASERAIIPTSFAQEEEMLLSRKRIEDAILEVLTWA